MRVRLPRKMWKNNQFERRNGIFRDTILCVEKNIQSHIGTCVLHWTICMIEYKSIKCRMKPCSTMMTSSNGNVSALLAICAGNSPVPVNSPHKGQWRGAFDVLFDLRLNKRLSKQSWGWWFETQSCPLWRQCNDSSTWLLTMKNTHQTTTKETWISITLWQGCEVLWLKRIDQTSNSLGTKHNGR